MTTAGPDSTLRRPGGRSRSAHPGGARAVLYAVRRIGDATVEDVARDLGITPSGARQHLIARRARLVEAVEPVATHPVVVGRGSPTT